MRRKKRKQRPPMSQEQKDAAYRRLAITAIERGVVSPYDAICAVLKNLPSGSAELMSLTGA